MSQTTITHLLRSIRCVAVVATLVSVVATSAMAGTWSRATGEAVELQRTTKDLRNRMSRLYCYAPATQNAIVLDQLASQLIASTKSNLLVEDLQAQLDQFDAVYQDVRLANATEAALASDHTVARYTAEIATRFNRLVKDLGRVKLPVYVGVAPQVFDRPLLGNGPILNSEPIIGSSPILSSPLLGSAPALNSATSPRDEAIIRYRIPRLLDRVLGGSTVIEQQAPAATVPSAPLPRISL